VVLLSFRCFVTWRVVVVLLRCGILLFRFVLWFGCVSVCVKCGFSLLCCWVGMLNVVFCGFV